MLVKHENNICDEFWKDLHEVKCYPKYGVEHNVKREIDNGDFTDLPAGRSIMVMADTENMALINDNSNKCLKQNMHLKEKSILII